MRWDEQSKKTLFPRWDEMRDFHIWFYLSLRRSYWWWDNLNQNRIPWHICRWTCDIKYSIVVLDFFMCLIEEKCDGWIVTILRTDFSFFLSWKVNAVIGFSVRGVAFSISFCLKNQINFFVDKWLYLYERDNDKLFMWNT